MPPSSEAPDAGGFRQAGRLLLRRRLRRRLRSGGRASLLVLLSLAAAAAFEAPLSPLRSRLHSLGPTEVQTTRASGPGPRRGGWCDGADDEQRCWNEPDTGRRASRQQGGISSEGSLLPPEAPGASPFPRVDDDSFAVDPPIPFGAARQQRREEPTAGVGGRSARAEASEERAAPAEQRLPEAGLDPETSTWPGEDQGSPQRRLREKRHGDRQRRPEGEDGEGGVVRYKDVSSHGQPYTVKVDGRFVRVGGRKTLLIAAGMPAYVFYSEGSDWPNFLRSARAAGCNAVHTAVVWAAHEQTPDVYDFIRPSANLVKFAQLAAANDLFLILDIWPAPEERPHWKNGGLPAWLDFNPRDPFEAAGARRRRQRARLRKWLRVLWRILKPLSAGAGGPLILLHAEDSAWFSLFVREDFFFSPSRSSSTQEPSGREQTRAANPTARFTSSIESPKAAETERPPNSADGELAAGCGHARCRATATDLRWEGGLAGDDADDDCLEDDGEAFDVYGQPFLELDGQPRDADGPQESQGEGDDEGERLAVTQYVSSERRAQSDSRVDSRNPRRNPPLEPLAPRRSWWRPIKLLLTGGARPASSGVGEAVATAQGSRRGKAATAQDRQGTKLDVVEAALRVPRKCSSARILSTLKVRRLAKPAGAHAEAPATRETQGDAKKGDYADASDVVYTPASHRADKEAPSSSRREQTRPRPVEQRPGEASAGNKFRDSLTAGGAEGKDQSQEPHLRSVPWGGGGERLRSCRARPIAFWGLGPRHWRSETYLQAHQVLGLDGVCEPKRRRVGEAAGGRERSALSASDGTGAATGRLSQTHPTSGDVSLGRPAEEADVREASAGLGDPVARNATCLSRGAPARRRRRLWEELHGALNLPLIYSLNVASSSLTDHSTDGFASALLADPALGEGRGAALLGNSLLLACAGDACGPPLGGIQGIPGSRFRSRVFLLGRERRALKRQAAKLQSLRDSFWRHCFFRNAPCVWLSAPATSASLSGLMPLAEKTKKTFSWRTFLGLSPELSEDVLAPLRDAASGEESGLTAAAQGEGCEVETVQWRRLLHLLEWRTLSSFVSSLLRGQRPVARASCRSRSPPFSQNSATATTALPKDESVSVQRATGETSFSFADIPVEALQDAMRFFAFGGTILSYSQFIAENPALVEIEPKKTDTGLGSAEESPLSAASNLAVPCGAHSQACLPPRTTSVPVPSPARRRLFPKVQVLGDDKHDDSRENADAFEEPGGELVPLNLWALPQTPLFDVLSFFHRFLEYFGQNLLELPTYALPFYRRAHVEIFPFKDLDIICNTHGKRTIRVPRKGGKTQLSLSPRSCYGYEKVTAASPAHGGRRHTRLVYSTPLYRFQQSHQSAVAGAVDGRSHERSPEVPVVGAGVHAAGGLPPWSDGSSHANLFVIADGGRRLEPQVWPQTLHQLDPVRPGATISIFSVGPAFCIREDAPASAMLGGASVLAFPQRLTQGWSDFVWYDVNLGGHSEETVYRGACSQTQPNTAISAADKSGTLAVRSSRHSSSVYVFSDRGELLGQHLVSANVTENARGNRGQSAHEEPLHPDELWFEVQVPPEVRKVVVLSSSFGAGSRASPHETVRPRPSWRSRFKQLISCVRQLLSVLCHLSVKHTAAVDSYPKRRQDSARRALFKTPRGGRVHELLWRSSPLEPTKRCIGLRGEPQLYSGVALQAFLERWGFTDAQPRSLTKEPAPLTKQHPLTTPKRTTGSTDETAYFDVASQVHTQRNAERGGTRKPFQWSTFIFSVPEWQLGGVYHILKVFPEIRAPIDKHGGDRVDKLCWSARRGRAYANSHFIGHFWLRDGCTTRVGPEVGRAIPTSSIKIPTDWMRPGENHIELLEEKGGFAGGVSIQEVLYGSHSSVLSFAECVLAGAVILLAGLMLLVLFGILIRMFHQRYQGSVFTGKEVLFRQIVQSFDPAELDSPSNSRAVSPVNGQSDPLRCHWRR